MPSVYVHLSGRDTNRAILNLYRMEWDPSDKGFRDNGYMKCSCGKNNLENANYCSNCGFKLDSFGNGKEEVCNC